MSSKYSNSLNCIYRCFYEIRIQALAPLAFCWYVSSMVINSSLLFFISVICERHHAIFLQFPTIWIFLISIPFCCLSCSSSPFLSPVNWRVNLEVWTNSGSFFLCYKYFINSIMCFLQKSHHCCLSFVMLAPFFTLYISIW